MKRKPKQPAGPDLFSPRCAECGAFLVRTSARHLACPEAHGKLFTLVEAPTPAAAEEPCGQLFPDLFYQE
jgi:hypothetical protein